MKEKSGITLIALIITIIIMLILVGITVGFVANGGLISKAKQAGKQTQIAADKELLEFDVILAMGTNGEISFSEFRTSATKDGFSINGSSLPCTATSKSGNEFSISADGKVTYIGEGELPAGDAELELLRKYFVGKSVESLVVDMEVEDPREAEFVDGTGDSSAVRGTDLTCIDADMDSGILYLFIRYEVSGKTYKISITGMENSNMTVTAIEPYNGGSGSGSSSSSSSSGQDNLGKHVIYGGIEYIVMAEDTLNGTVDLISANAIQVDSSDITLGYKDPEAALAIPAANANTSTSAEEEAWARWSYNNAIETLVTACKNATGLTVDGTDVISIRSVGNTNVKYISTGITGSDNPGTYTYSWQTAGASSDWYTASGYNSYNMKAGDENYQTDLSTMQTLGIAQADNNTAYWLASRIVYENSSSVKFDVRLCDTGALLESDLCNMYSGYINCFNSYRAVRPIVTLSFSAISAYLN